MSATVQCRIIADKNVYSQGEFSRPERPITVLCNFLQFQSAIFSVLGLQLSVILLCNKHSSNLSVGNSYYVATKYALALWVRRVSASWAANGVRINAVAPGNVATPMTATMSAQAKAALEALPIPINYGSNNLMQPEDIAAAVAFLVSPKAHGINGVNLFVDGGTDALLNPDKVY